MKKVIFTCNRIGTGGAERVITNIANRMSKDGIEVKLICYDVLDGFYYPINEGVEIVEIDKELGKHKGVLSRKLYGCRNLYRLYAELKRQKPDVVISFYTKQTCYSILCANLLGIPIVGAERDHFFLSDGRISHILRKVFYKRATGFIHQTTWAKKYLEENYKTPLNAIVMHNPLWISEYPERCPEKNTVVAVGRLALQKNYLGMIRAFDRVVQEIPDAKLKIYGNGEQRDKLEREIDAHHLNNNIFLMGQTENVVEQLSKADAYIMFSHGEGYPNALMEALACGVPCVASDCPVGGPAELIENNVNGFLTQNEDIDALAEKVIDLLKNDTTKARFSKEAIKIRQTNSVEYIYPKLMEYLNLCIRSVKKA